MNSLAEATFRGFEAHWWGGVPSDQLFSPPELAAVSEAGRLALLGALSELYGIPTRSAALIRTQRAELKAFLRKHGLALAYEPSNASASTLRDQLPHALLLQVFRTLPKRFFRLRNAEHHGKVLWRNIVASESEHKEPTEVYVGAHGDQKVGAHGDQKQQNATLVIHRYLYVHVLAFTQLVLQTQLSDVCSYCLIGRVLLFGSNAWRNARLFPLQLFHSFGVVWARSCQLSHPSEYSALASLVGTLAVLSSLPYYWPLPDGTPQGRRQFIASSSTPAVETLAEVGIHACSTRKREIHTCADAIMAGSVVCFWKKKCSLQLRIHSNVIDMCTLSLLDVWRILHSRSFPTGAFSGPQPRRTAGA